MKICLKQTVISNIRSFANESIIDFPSGFGLFHLNGENKVDPQLGANGSGKSTMFCCLSWILFGKWPGGLTSPTIARWNSKKGSVYASCLLSVDGEDVQVSRSWNPNWIKIDDDRCNDEDVLKLVGMDADSFSSSVLIGQGSKLFLDLPSVNRSALVSSILGLNEWESRRDFSAKIVKDAEKECDQIEKEIANTAGKIEALQSISYEQNVREWDLEKDRNKEECVSKVKTLKDDIAKVGKNIGKLQLEKDKVEVELRDQKGRTFDVLELERKEQRMLDKHSGRLKSARKEYDQLGSRIDQLSDTKKCYACGQELSSLDQKNMLDSEKDRLEVTEDEIDDLIKNVRYYRKECTLLESKVKDARESEAEKQIKYNSITDRISVAKSYRSRVVTELDYLEKNAAKANKENPWKKKESQRRRQLNSAKMDSGNLKKELQEVRKENDHVSYWVKGFNQLRLDLIGRAVRSLENESNANLSYLGMGNWSIELSVDRETKSKTVTKGFHVMVRSPDSLEAIPLDVWSGGESQRLRLAITMGLSDMIQDYLGSQWGIEIYDEPCSWLSSDGIEALLSALKERAIRTKKAIWVVDHRSLGSGAFDRRAIMIKDEKGSRFEWEK